MTNHRLTFAAAIAVLAASLSLGSLLVGTSWLMASIGVVAAVALAGTLTRLATLQAAIAASVAVLIAIVPVLAGYGWLGLAGGLVVLGLTVASATGARLLRAFAGLATYVAVPFVYLTAVFAGSSAWASVIPNSASLAALARLPGAASGEFKYSPPIPTSRPVEFIAVGGVAVVAICVDVLAVRLRRPALAGLPLLLLFSVPVASSLKRFTILQTLLFGLAIAAYLALLAADGRQRLRMWGRLVTIRRTHAGDDAGQGPDTRQVAASGRRVGLTAVVLAMVVPVFLAGTPPKDLFAKTSSSGPGTGLAIPGGLAPLDNVGNDLAEKPTLEFTYQTTNPLPTQQYFQQYVLNYDYALGGKWLLGASSGQTIQNDRMPYPIPGLTAEVPAARERTSVSLTRIVNAPLPMPYAPVQIQSSDLNLTETSGSLMVFDPQQLTTGQYNVTSKEAEPSAAALAAPAVYPQSIVHAYTGYRGPDRARLLQIARQQTGGATSALAKAIDLQRWFNSTKFTYSLHERWPDSGPWLLHFLTNDPRGDCEQFAPAFAVLARLVGIPSRVAIGFTGGTFAGHGLWRVTSADAHAWPELYFPGAGWVRFEPTPAGSEGVAGQGTATTPDYTVGVVPAGPGKHNQHPTSQPTASSTQGAGAQHKINTKQIQAGEGPRGSALHAKPGFPVWIIVLLAVLLLLASPALVRWLTRRRRWMSASTDSALARVAWREFLDNLTDFGQRPEPSESPRAVARRVAAEAKLDAAGCAAAARIGAAEERARYSLGSVPGTELRADVAATRRALAARASRLQRLRAWLLPPSIMVRALTALQASGHALSWIEAPLPSWRRSRSQPEPGQAR